MSVNITLWFVFFIAAKSLNKEVISWTTFLFALSSILFKVKKKKKAQSTSSHLNNELYFNSYNHRAALNDSKSL